MNNSENPSLDETYQYWFKRVLNLLVRREHSIVELHQKIVSRGCPTTIATLIIQKNLELNYLNLDRFAYSYTKNRADLGYGPIRIRYELQQHEISQNLIEKTFMEIDWHVARQIAERKIRHQDPLKRKQALYRRGFNS